MKFCLSMFLVTALMTQMVSGHSDTSLWDIIPGTAQIKSLFQLVVGDTSGAKKTQLNFLNEGLGPAQLRSAYFFATGEPKKALKVQGKFVSNLEPLVDSLPVVGHIKGGIHLLTGDQQHGWDAIKSATSTTGTIVGGMISGPFGVIGGHLLTDMAISSANLVLNVQNAKFHGVAEYIKNIYKKDSGEHFDELAGMAIDGYTGSKTKVKDSKVASQEIEAESISNSVRELERGMTFFYLINCIFVMIVYNLL